ncbi:MAG: TlpA family protein disulfide reductase [Verrucomicrobiaceae bacterium]|nr:MAG: TlpA family protein disulfide reductase [Verrucomicrobiaceae bacterium]
MPRLLIPPRAAQPGTIRWLNGESLAGKPGDITAEGVSWSSALFKSPLLLRREQLERIDFSVAPPQREAPFRVILIDGGQFSGTPEKMENGILFLRGAHSGLVELRQENIAAIERISGEGVIVGGPQALLTPVPAASPEAGSGTPWYLAAAGRLVSHMFRQGITLPWKLPDKSSVELSLNCDRRPEFSLKLAADEGSCAVETWGDELVLTDGEEFTSAGSAVQSGPGRAFLRLAWDRPAGRRVLYSTEGKVLAELTVPPVQKGAPGRRKKKPAPGGLKGALKQLMGLNGGEGPPDTGLPAAPPVENGVTFQNKGAGVVLERFTVSEWSGDPLPALLGGQTGLETGTAALPGELAGISAGVLTLRGTDGQTRDFPLATVRAFRWDRAVGMERDVSLTDLWFADGDLLRGRLKGAKEGTATMEIAAAAQPVNSKWEGGRMLMLPRPQPDKEQPREPLKGMDELSWDSGSGPEVLHGKILTESQGPLPRFSLIGAVSPAELVPAPSLALTWAPPEENIPDSAPALLHLKNGETLPVKSAGLNQGTIQLSWEEAVPRQLNSELIQAVQFAASPAAAQGGFEDPGWQFLGTGQDQPPREGGNGQVTLTPGMGIAHPFILQEGGLSFRLSPVSGLASIRVRLFSQGAERSSGGTNFLIADYGGSIYAGVERTEGQIDSQQSIPSGRGYTDVRLALEGGVAEIFVNGVSIGKARRDAENGKKSGNGNGLIIETASLWGNQIGTLKLSDLSCHFPAFQIPAPVFTQEAKREALLLPRMRRDDPPRQVLIGRNGDLLRGQIEALTSTHLAFRSGLESFKVPIDRVAAAVWVKKPQLPVKATGASGNEARGGEKAVQAENPPDGDSLSGTPDGRQWLDLKNGGRLILTNISWNGKEVTAKHSLLGECRIPASSLGRLLSGTPVPGTAWHVLSGWKLEAAPDPVLPDGTGGSPLIGKEAAEFKLALLEGGDFSLKEHRGKVVVLDFWATWCGPCVKSLPGLLEAMAEFPPEQAVLITVNQGEPNDRISRFLEARRLTMVVALDADQGVAGKYGVEGIPHTVVIGPDGKIAFVKTGYSPDGEKQIAEAVRQALKLGKAEDPASVGETGTQPSSSGGTLEK